MKITKVILSTVVVPAHADRVNSPDYGPAVFDEVEKIVIEAHTDVGFIGLGETPRGVNADQISDSFRLLKHKDVLGLCFRDPPIVDLSTNDLYAHEHPRRPHRFWERSLNAYEHSGVHTALLDLLGKYAKLPVHALLGGAYRHCIPVSYWMGRMTPTDSARVCRQAKLLGYRSVKCKCSLEDDNIERAEAVREACGADFTMTFDPNQRFYRFAEAIPMLRRLVEVGNIGCVEDPFPKTNLHDYCLLRQLGLCPVAIHTSYGPALLEATHKHACDYVNLDGLPWDVICGAGICSVAGIPTWRGSGLDLGIAEAMSLHICAACKSMVLPSDILGRSIREHNLLSDPLSVLDGYVSLPQGTGLGVELDRDALDKYLIRQVTLEL